MATSLMAFGNMRIRKKLPMLNTDVPMVILSIPRKKGIKYAK
jgi:hypothetical protein